jgi:uncharacterized LabA/DUF88 family protein
MRTNVYIDSLNLYYGSLKNTPYKWLDLKKLSQCLLSDKNEIHKIKFYTAMVKPTEVDPHVSKRQQIYHRALRHYIPEVEIIKGHFSEHVVSMMLEQPINDQKFVKVVKREEKGSDVNLAVHFLNDAMNDDYDCGVVISNDSDLTEAVKLVRRQTDKIIGVISPFDKISKELSQYAHFKKKIRPSVLQQSQLPENIPSSNIKKIESWY